MIDRPIWLRLHPRQIVEAAPPLIQHKALAVEVHREKFANPTLIDRTDARIVAESPRIRVHQHMGLRHIAELHLIDVAQPHIVIAYALLHMTVTLYGQIVLVPNIVHQIVIVTAAEIGTNHIKAQGIDLPDEIVIAVKDVDVFEAVAVRAQFPERGCLHLAEILRFQKFRILVCKLLGIGHDCRLEVEILHDLLRKDRRIPSPILEHQIERTRRQRLPIAIVVENIPLRDRHIALIVQFRQLSAQLLLADERTRIADAVDAEVGKCNKAAILSAHIRVGKGLIRLKCKEEICNDVQRREQNHNLYADAHFLPSVLPPCKILKTDFTRKILRGFLLLHPAPPTCIFFACSFSCFFFNSSKSACVRRVPHVVFQNVTHATGICQSSTAS